MASTVDICNLALGALGEPQILSLTEANPRARNCNLYYPLERNAVLRELKPGSVVTRAELAQDATAPVFGYDYAYILPGDCIFVLETQPDTPWKVEGRRLLSDEPTMKIAYAFREPDPTQFDEGTVQAIAARLAWRMCEALTGSVVRKRELWGDYETMLRKARADTRDEAHEADDLDDYPMAAARLR